ncbi:glucosamine-6-phosphate deaminase [Agromyces aerolatus]|uniref:glucosamine-6-phosphate deaminase n=1 Tax=Agromyces sp. LY-1074 TaxID=3074080 RepID=UPI00285E4E5A|nr:MULTISPECIES: glucosamine-6-phosphate deaminase [unclassified Agromyces]MDR5700201.1 glucosamine-6-phosphate deaminase [Agromyces sp. LY-1074]MDR5706431.1 glucosamine-6-phosphate deaminase [Agromyces sp. LY-1358]
MQVIIAKDADDVGEIAAGIIARRIETDDLSVLGVATGSSPLPVYRALERRHPAGLGELTVFALDEYVGLPYEHPESYHSVVEREVAAPLGLRRDRVHVPDGMADDLDDACRRYEEAIDQAGGVDLQILGVGANGHIGFNEPTSSFTSRTRVKTLAQATRDDNARFFDRPEDVPIHCITQGLGTIMSARSVLLVAQGTAKAAPVAAVVEGSVTSMCPGSILQMHPDATIVVDEAAAAQLTLAEYYRFVYDNRPDWQR